MIDLLRRISLCNRVLYLSFGMAALVLGLGAALVEEATAATQSLREQAGRPAQTMSAFQVVA